MEYTQNIMSFLTAPQSGQYTDSRQVKYVMSNLHDKPNTGYKSIEFVQMITLERWKDAIKCFNKISFNIFHTSA